MSDTNSNTSVSSVKLNNNKWYKNPYVITGIIIGILCIIIGIILLITLLNSGTKYSCNDDGVCSSDTNGKYTTKKDCESVCTQPVIETTYSCVNNVCTPKTNGKYKNIGDCESACTQTTYSCNDGVCSPKTNGKYKNIGDCESACTQTTYSCNDGVCSPKTNGKYKNIGDCESACTQTTYSCNDGVCSPKTNGKYKNIGDCESACTQTTYSCNDGVCSSDTNGKYTTKKDCESACTQTTYSCNDDGVCSPDTDGKYTTSDCDNMCPTINITTVQTVTAKFSVSNAYYDNNSTGWDKTSVINYLKSIKLTPTPIDIDLAYATNDGPITITFKNFINKKDIPINASYITCSNGNFTCNNGNITHVNINTENIKNIKTNTPVYAIFFYPNPTPPSNQCTPYKGQDGSSPGPLMYCCPGPDGSDPGVTSAECNAGPVNSTQWCQLIHKNCVITKSDTDSGDIGKPAVYCQAYDDTNGLSVMNSSTENRYKMIFSDIDPTNDIKYTGIDIKSQTQTIQIVNSSPETLWIAYIINTPAVNGQIITSGYNSGWGIYPSEYSGTKNQIYSNNGGKIRVDSGSYVYFPGFINSIGVNLTGRIWAMVGCDNTGSFCKIGGSASKGGLEGCGYNNGNNQGYLYTSPIDSKFEFNIFSGNGDWFDTSAVDGLTLPFVFSYYGQNNQGNTSLTELKCGVSENECPSNENVYINCNTQQCPQSPSEIYDLSYRNVDGDYIGCSSLCGYMSKAGYNKQQC